MCDFFFQRMENNEGDLADIVRPTGLAGPSTSDLPIADWQLPALPAGDFGDPFTNQRDPLLHGSPGPAFFDRLEPTTLGPEMKRPCNNVFSRMLQISPGVSKASPMSPRAIKPSPIITSGSVCCPADHGDAGGVQISSPRTPGIKRRKSQAKKVVCIPAPAAAGSRPTGEVVPSDLWAWRKYGQKPIKGSPYPRGYYRCSSSKGCSARKQVERSRTDPNMLVITYTSEHNHPWPTQRNALAGSTRSQSAKNSSSASKRTTSPRKQRSPTSFKEEQTSVKQEVVEMEKTIDMEGNQELEQVFHQSYKTMMQDSNPSDDFFADLAELEPDPMDLIFSKDNRESKALDPFNMFDWAGNSFGESKKSL